MTRWSTPSKRPQTITAPGPAASSRTRACVSGLPRGLISSRGRGSPVGRGVVDRLGQNIGAHHHAGAAAGRRVVDGAVPVGGEIADLHGLERPGSGLQRPAGQRQAERARKHFGIERQHAWRGNSPVASGILRSARTPLRVEAGRVAVGSVRSPSSSSSSTRPAATVSMRMKPRRDVDHAARRPW